MSARILCVARAAALFASLALGSTALYAQDAAATAALVKKLDTSFEAARRDAAKWPDVIQTGEAILAVDAENPTALHHVGYAYHASGRLDEALALHLRTAALDDPRFASIGAYNAACAYALKGDKENALTWLETSVEKGFGDVAQLKGDTDLVSLHDEPRFTAIADGLAGKGAAKKSTKAPGFVASQVMKRAGTRVAVFSESGAIGQVAIEYGPVTWKDEYQKHIEAAAQDGARWRLGNDFWTNLAADVPFTLGGQRFAPGDYYLIVERKGDAYALTLLDPKVARDSKLDPYWVQNLAGGGTSVALKHSEADEPAGALEIKVATESKDSTAGKLTIAFGPHRLETSFEIHVG
jgi:tetratricopeptide (TPR) repeat protein